MRLQSFNRSLLLGVIGLLMLIVFSAESTTLIQQSTCESELTQKGYSKQNQKFFCQNLNTAQWSCSETILEKYHSLELAKETCLRARSSEISCYNNILDRGFDPYVAKRVCQLKKD